MQFFKKLILGICLLIGVSTCLAACGKTVTYQIEYHLDGGVNHAQNPSSYTATDQYFTLGAPTKPGYAFEGWYRDAALQFQVTAVDPRLACDVVLYAKWVPQTYQITYMLDRGVVNATTNPQVYSVLDGTLTLAAPTRLGYAFDGWYADVDFTQALPTLDAAVNGAVTLYAKWSQAYQIIYSLGEGTNAAANPAYYRANATDLIVLQDPIRENYLFGGWYTSTSFASNTRVTVIDPAAQTNISLFAQWFPIFTITYDLNGGSVVDNPTTYNASLGVLTLKAAAKRGYAFEGWFDAEEQQYTVLNPENVQAALHLKAKFSLVHYQVIYVFDFEDTNNPNLVDTYDVTMDAIPLQDASLTGYLFFGWYTNGLHQPDSIISELNADLIPDSGTTITLYSYLERAEDFYTYTTAAASYGGASCVCVTGIKRFFMNYKLYPTNLIIPKQLDGKNVTEIAASAFNYTESGQDQELAALITQVTLPPTLQYLGFRAFTGTMITEVLIPRSVPLNSGYTNAFWGCPLLSSNKIIHE